MLANEVLNASRHRCNNILMFWNEQNLSPVIISIIVVIKSHPLAILFLGIDLT